MKLFQVFIYCASTSTIIYASFKAVPAHKELKCAIVLIIMSQLYTSSVMGYSLPPLQTLYLQTLCLKQELDKNYNQNSIVLYYYPRSHTRCEKVATEFDYDSRLIPDYEPPDIQECPDSTGGLIQSLEQNVFSARQQKAFIEVLELLGINLHDYDLATIVRMTQCNELDQLTIEQQQQCQKWTIKEGEIVRESHALQKERLVFLLRQMKLYQTLIPGLPSTGKVPYHTLLLGGSIQQMQMRFLTMLAYFDNYGTPGEHSLGNQMTLTCNRIVNYGQNNESDIEIDLHRDTIWFATDGGHILTGPGRKTPVKALTEDTAYRAIYYAVKSMCEDDAYFKNHRYSVTGFHPPGHYPEISAINYLYKKRKYYYELTDEFRSAACRFVEQYPLNTYSSPEYYYGTGSVGRPTTKETVKNWIDQHSPCTNGDFCNILVVSSQPNARYQQVAVMQGVEDKIAKIDTPGVRVMLTAIGSSVNIPTNEVLDNLSRVLYMIMKRPPR